MFWIIAILAVAACSITLARSAMLVQYRRQMTKWHPKLGDLSRCHYCTSHWLALAVVLLYRPTVGGLFFADLLLAWLALVGGAAVVSGIVLFLTPFRSPE